MENKFVHDHNLSELCRDKKVLLLKFYDQYLLDNYHRVMFLNIAQRNYLIFVKKHKNSDVINNNTSIDSKVTHHVIFMSFQ